MSQININNLSFAYYSYGEDIFKNVSVVLDTDWKLGLIGRNGRGKTTLLKLLLGELTGSGTITSSVGFGYFPMDIEDKTLKTIDVVKNAIAPFAEWENLMEIYSRDENKLEEYGDILEKYIYNDGYIIEELIKKEIGLMGSDVELLERSFDTLSGGEQTKMLLVALFLRKNHFLLIDEPTNHLDIDGRKIIGEYLKSKKGFILVSHDRHFIDDVVDHVMSINKSNIEIQKGNYSTWQMNKEWQDSFEIAENEKLKGEIGRLEKTMKEKVTWSDRIEATKTGHGVPDRGFIGHKSAKMMKRAKSIENRQTKAIEEKSKLLKNIEQDEKLELFTADNKKEKVVVVNDLTINYGDKNLFIPLSFEVNKGECVWLRGSNGTGKTSILKMLMGDDITCSGEVKTPKNISYVSQDTSFLKGNIKDFILENQVDGVILRSNLHKLGFNKDHFDKNIEDWSEGQKKKLLIAKSLCDRAELYIWDEPLNFIDIITRGQIEKLVRDVKPTMIIVEHDATFVEKVVTKIVDVVR